jgi:hypothetical protein
VVFENVDRLNPAVALYPERGLAQAFFYRVNTVVTNETLGVILSSLVDFSSLNHTHKILANSGRLLSSAAICYRPP